MKHVPRLVAILSPPPPTNATHSLYIHNKFKHHDITKEIHQSFEIPHSVFVLKIINADLKKD